MKKLNYELKNLVWQTREGSFLHANGSAPIPTVDCEATQSTRLPQYGNTVAQDKTRLGIGEIVANGNLGANRKTDFQCDHQKSHVRDSVVGQENQ